jgi:ABC-2 type transport system ATP-binding protein
VAVEDVDSLLATSARHVEIVFAGDVAREVFTGLDGVSDLRVDGPVLRCRLDGRADALVKAAARHTVLSITSEEPDLEQVFFHRYAAGPAPDPERGTAS